MTKNEALDVARGIANKILAVKGHTVLVDLDVLAQALLDAVKGELIGDAQNSYRDHLAERVCIVCGGRHGEDEPHWDVGAHLEYEDARARAREAYLQTTGGDEPLGDRVADAGVSALMRGGDKAVDTATEQAMRQQGALAGGASNADAYRHHLAERVLLAVLRAPDFEMPQRPQGVSRVDNLAAFCYRMADAMAKASK